MVNGSITESNSGCYPLVTLMVNKTIKVKNCNFGYVSIWVSNASWFDFNFKGHEDL